VTTIGLIGAGLIGGTVARLAADGGYDVVLSNSLDRRRSRSWWTTWEIIQLLEPRVGALLFERTSRHVRLTSRRAAPPRDPTPVRSDSI
jgi:8-hydroxy-5-deazaflavin:NADPH oxidoreductase